MKTLVSKKDATSSSSIKQVVDVNGYPIYFDGPKIIGGADEAPNPHAYLNAAVAACKAITIRLVAKRRKIALQDVNVTLHCDDSEERKGRYVMNFDIQLIGDLTEKQRQMLLSAAESCPVGKLLTEDVVVELNSRLV
ncbi:MAG: hypothetical protein CSA45_01385 [Gammaproteobacteria bacterium]|nr:MAG: hypothetical protein CSA45_01385 [Gammaproteobacteria bacterium]